MTRFGSDLVPRAPNGLNSRRFPGERCIPVRGQIRLFRQELGRISYPKLAIKCVSCLKITCYKSTEANIRLSLVVPVTQDKEKEV